LEPFDFDHSSRNSGPEPGGRGLEIISVLHLLTVAFYIRREKSPAFPVELERWEPLSLCKVPDSALWNTEPLAHIIHTQWPRALAYIAEWDVMDCHCSLPKMEGRSVLAGGVERRERPFREPARNAESETLRGMCTVRDKMFALSNGNSLQSKTLQIDHKREKTNRELDLGGHSPQPVQSLDLLFEQSADKTREVGVRPTNERVLRNDRSCDFQRFAENIKRVSVLELATRLLGVRVRKDSMEMQGLVPFVGGRVLKDSM
jgi:hypothetical protein